MISGRVFNYLCYMPPGVGEPKVPYRAAMLVVRPLMLVDRLYWLHWRPWRKYVIWQWHGLRMALAAWVFPTRAGYIRRAAFCHTRIMRA